MLVSEVIICVDDEKEILEILQRQLMTMFGQSFEYEFAESGEEALELIQELETEHNTQVRLVISDWSMPGIKGDELILRLKESRPEIKTLLLTGQAPEDILTKVCASGSSNCMLKPWDRESLKERIQLLMAS